MNSGVLCVGLWCFRNVMLMLLCFGVSVSCKGVGDVLCVVVIGWKR